MKVLGLLVLAIVFTAALSTPIGKSDGLLITADNILSLASFVDDSVTVGQRSITCGLGGTNQDYNEKLLVIPLAAAGELHPQATVRITIGIKPSTTGHNPNIGVSDGSYKNTMFLYQRDNSAACAPDSGTHDGNTRPIAAATPAHYTLLYKPQYRYGACETAQYQQGGYVNTMTFNAHVDVTKGLDLVIFKNWKLEVYEFYYLLVEAF